jgi:ankyrin repeat protein
MKTTVHIIWGSHAVSLYKSGIIDATVKLAHGAYDFFTSKEADAFIFGISEARKPEDWAIIKKTSDVNKIGKPVRTLLIDAAIRGDIETVEKILNMGINPDSGDHTGMTALHHAAKHGHVEIVEALIKANANVNARADGEQGETPLHFAVNRNSTNHHKIVDALLTTQANIELEDIHQNKVLHYSVRENNLVCTKKLLDAGANPESLNIFGESPKMVIGTKEKFKRESTIIPVNKPDAETKKNITPINPLNIAASIKSGIPNKMTSEKRQQTNAPNKEFINICESVDLNRQAVKNDINQPSAEELRKMMAIRQALQYSIERKIESDNKKNKNKHIPYLKPNPFNGH